MTERDPDEAAVAGDEPADSEADTKFKELLEKDARPARRPR